MINDPTIDLETLVAYEGRMGEQAQAAREQVAALRASTPLSALITQARGIGPRPTLADLLAQDGFTALHYQTESIVDGPASSSVAIAIVEDGEGTSDGHAQAAPLSGTIFKLTNAGQGPNFQHYLDAYINDPAEVLICDDIVVDPWQLWRSKAMGFSAVILHIGAQVTPDLTNMIRVCQEVGLEWILKADYTHQIDEGLAAYQDAFVSQPPCIALGLNLDGEPITHQKVIEINERIALPDDGCYLPYCFVSDKFQSSLESGTNPVVNAYLEAGITGGIAVHSAIRRFFDGQ